MLSHSLVLGYHGCDQSLAEAVVAGKEYLKPSQNEWDWLGHGIYFWEDSYSRALKCAEAQSRQRASKIKIPAAIGAVVQLGNCLNLTDTDALALVKGAHQAYMDLCAISAARVLENRGRALQVRYLDCAVIETLHQIRRQEAKLHSILSADSSWRAGNFIQGLDSGSWTTFKFAFDCQSRLLGIFFLGKDSNKRPLSDRINKRRGTIENQRINCTAEPSLNRSGIRISNRRY